MFCNLYKSTQNNPFNGYIHFCSSDHIFIQQLNLRWKLEQPNILNYTPTSKSLTANYAMYYSTSTGIASIKIFVMRLTYTIQQAYISYIWLYSFLLLLYFPKPRRHSRKMWWYCHQMCSVNTVHLFQVA